MNMRYQIELESERRNNSVGYLPMFYDFDKYIGLSKT